ncbi:MAG TPA: BTAD domain-containing putative transcriptional regulator [Gemmatimonadaceae bacterium]|nr:BTAD domain-containing putative transcriptional regulator [Gemmatimonadaceae bacterium]
MINLQVLGRLELTGANGRVLDSVLAQPKRQAVLAYLAVAVPRGYHRRDSLVALLWPERDDEHARGSLSKAVSYLRQALGADALISRGHAELGLDWHLVWCDAAGFEDAFDRGALAEAMALYRGDLLPGFHVDEAPEFDHWLERERARLRGRALQASRMLSEREEAAGRLAASIEWARRAMSLDAFDEASVRRVIAVLDKASDRAGALRTYDEFSALLRAELDAEPDAETTALMESIRDRQTPRAEMPSAPPIDSAPVIETQTSREPAVAANSVPRPRSIWRTRMAAIGSAALAIVLLVAWVIVGRDRADATHARFSVAVSPFVVEGAAHARDVGERLARAISARLDREGSLRAVDAASASARFRLLGRIDARGDSIDVTATLFDTIVGREPIAHAAATGFTRDVDSLSADIAWQIMTLQPTSIAPRVHQPPTHFTASLVAVRAFMDGERALRSGRFAEAMKAYKSAVDADTTFALGYVDLSRAAMWAGDYAMSDFATQRALRYADRLSPLDQTRVRAWWAYEAGRPLEADRLTRLVLANDIGTADAWYELGELRFHWGPMLGWTKDEARDAFEQALAITGEASSIVHLARIAASEGRGGALDSLVRRALAMGVDEPQALELRVLRAHVAGDRAESDRLHAAIARLDDNAAFSVVSFAAASTAEYPLARGLADALTSPRRAQGFRVRGAILSAEMAMARGKTADAMTALVAGPLLTPARSIEYRAALASLPFRATPSDEARTLRAELLAQHDEGLIGPGADHFAVNSIYPPRRGYLLAMLSLKMQDTASAMKYARQLDSATENVADAAYQHSVARLVRAEVLHGQGRASDALAALGSPAPLPGGVLPDVLHYPAAHERFLRAELLRAVGRPREALRWYETFPDPGAYDIMYRAPVFLGAASAYQQLSLSDSARQMSRRAAALLADADADWAPLLARARSGP